MVCFKTILIEFFTFHILNNRERRSVTTFAADDVCRDEKPSFLYSFFVRKLKVPEKLSVILSFQPNFTVTC